MGVIWSSTNTNCNGISVELKNDIEKKYTEIWSEINSLKEGRKESQKEIMLGIKKEFEGLQENLMQRQKLYEESQQNEMHALKGKICDIATVVQTLEKAGKSLMADLKNERGIFKDLQKNFSEEEKKIEGLKANIQALKEQINAREFEEVIPRKSLWQQFKESNVIVKVIVVAIPMSVIVAIYVIKRYYLSKQRAIAAESIKDNENDNFLPVPWRSLHKTLTEIPEIKHYLMQSITKELKDSTLNILLLGETGSGKSSFVNACFTALLQEGQYIARATAGAMTSDSVTLRLAPYTLEVKVGEEEKRLPVKLFDCRGLFFGDRGVKTADIKKICKGHIKDGYMINPKIGIKATDKEYRNDPLEEHRMHCIVFVLAADEEGFVTEGVEEQMKDIKKIFREDTLQLILLTKIDRLGIEDISHIFRDKRVKERCEQAAKFLGRNSSDVFPQSSYSDEVVSIDFKDLITLFNINTIMKRTRKRMNKHDK